MKVLILLIVLFCSINFSVAQSQHDLQSWSAIKITKRLDNQKWDFSIRQELRLKDRLAVLDNILTEFGVKYIGNKNFAIAGAYRVRLYQKAAKYTWKHRLGLDFLYQHRIRNWTLSNRLRLQRQSLIVGSTADDVQYGFRFYQQFAYNIKKPGLKPYVQFELFSELTEHLAETTDAAEGDYWLWGINKVRLTTGMAWKVSKPLKINIFYRLNTKLKSYELYDDYAFNHVIGIYFCYKIQGLKKD